MNVPRQDSGPAPSEANQRKAMRVAFFGGSFDPPHMGHLAVARAARAALALDAVLFAPVGRQPLKPEGSAANFEDRLAMTRLAIADEPGFEVSLADAPKAAADRGSAPNYTIDTLENLRSTLATGCTLFCLMGADSFFGLHRWHRAAQIPFVAQLIVAARSWQPLEGIERALPPGLSLEPAPEEQHNASGAQLDAFQLVNAAGDRAPFYLLPGLHVEISASEIRRTMRAQMQAAHGDEAAAHALVPAAVRNYIAQHRLYCS